mgnify:CR=1 FL=1
MPPRRVQWERMFQDELEVVFEASPAVHFRVREGGVNAYERSL